MRSELLPVVGRYAARSDRFETVLADLPEAAWSAPSPCPTWTALDVVQHVLEMHASALRALQFPPTPAPSVHEDPHTAFRAARYDLAAALLRHDRLSDRGSDQSSHQAGDRAGEALHQVDRVLGAHLVVHAWDLARAAGRRHMIDPRELDRLWHRAQLEPCGPALVAPPGASLQDRLLARLGRDPSWTGAFAPT